MHGDEKNRLVKSEANLDRLVKHEGISQTDATKCAVGIAFQYAVEGELEEARRIINRFVPAPYWKSEQVINDMRNDIQYGVMIFQLATIVKERTGIRPTQPMAQA